MLLVPRPLVLRFGAPATGRSRRRCAHRWSAAPPRAQPRRNHPATPSNIVGQYSVSASSAAFALFVPALLFCARRPRRGRPAGMPTRRGRRRHRWLAVISWSRSSSSTTPTPPSPAISATRVLVAAASVRRAEAASRPQRAGQAAASDSCWGVRGRLRLRPPLVSRGGQAQALLAVAGVPEVRPAVADGTAHWSFSDCPGCPRSATSRRGCGVGDALPLPHAKCHACSSVQELESCCNPDSPRFCSCPSGWTWRAPSTGRTWPRGRTSGSGRPSRDHGPRYRQDPLLRPRLSDGSASSVRATVGRDGPAGGRGGAGPGAGAAFSREFVVRVTPPLPEISAWR